MGEVLTQEPISPPVETEPAGRSVGTAWALWLLRRIGLAVLTLWLVSVLVFFATAALGDPIRAILGKDYATSPERVATLTEQLQLDEPLVQRYFDWLGGLLTNFSTIQRSIARLRDLEAMSTDGRYDFMPKKEIARAEKEKRKLQKNLDGIRHMGRLPDALFVVDTRKEQIAVDEARKLKIPVIGVVDTNCDPDQVDFVIPGNDDALRSIRLFASRVADAVLDGRNERESQMAEQAQADAEAAAAEEANRTVRPANVRRPQRPAESPVAN